MARIEKSVLVRAPVKKIFDYLNDPLKLQEYWPEMAEVKEVEHLPNGGSTFKYTYKMAGFTLHGCSEDTEIVPLKRMVSESTGDITARLTWELEPVEFGVRVHLKNEYSFKLPVIGKLGEAFLVGLNEKEADRILDNLKTRME
jgi:hypothetical protein